VGESDATTSGPRSSVFVHDTAASPLDLGEFGIDARYVEREVVQPRAARLEEFGDRRGFVHGLHQLEVGFPDCDERDTDPVRGNVLRRALGRADDGSPTLDCRGEVGHCDPYVIELQTHPPA
jgi:hypothetical protein